MVLKKRSLFVSLSFLSFLAGVLLSGCMGKRNLYPEKESVDQKQVLIREWTRPTRELFEAGQSYSEYSNPVFYENTLIFGNQTSGLVALYSKMNAVRWSLPIFDGVISPITLSGENLYFGGGDGYLYSVRADNGRVNWRYAVRNPILSRPQVQDGRLFVNTSDDTVYSFDAGTGQWLWHYRRRSSLPATILGASSPLVLGDRVFAGLSDGFLVALSLQDGKLLWERKLHDGRKFTDVDASPVFKEGKIYVPSYDGALYALDQASGSVIWRFDAGGSKRVHVEGDTLFFPSSAGFVYALDRRNGKVKWKFELDHGVPTDLAVTDTHLFFGSSYQYIYAITKGTGKIGYRFNAGFRKGFSGAPAFNAKTGKLYLLSGNGNLYSFRLRTPPRKSRDRVITDPFRFFAI